MSPNRPHYLLLSESRPIQAVGVEKGGHWRFVLESADGQDRLEAGDCESATTGERLELLTVVRGLEALNQPSHVTLVTSSRYVSRGLRFGLSQWRRSDWCWEYDGEMVPVTNHDLWQRLDRALQFHDVRCRWLRIDPWRRSPSSCRAATPLSRCGATRRGCLWQNVAIRFKQQVAMLAWALSWRVRLKLAA